MKRALCLIKPDGIEALSDIKNYLHSKSLKIIAESNYHMLPEDIRFLYRTILQSQPYAVDFSLKSMGDKTVVLILCEGDDTVYTLLHESKQILRKKHMKDNAKGIIHTPDTELEANEEIEYFSLKCERLSLL